MTQPEQSEDGRPANAGEAARPSEDHARVSALEEAVHACPGNGHAWAMLGLAYGKLSQWELATEAARRATRLAPSDAQCWWVLGMALWEAADPTAALDATRRALQLAPDQPRLWLALGVSLGDHRLGSLKALPALTPDVRVAPPQSPRVR